MDNSVTAPTLDLSKFIETRFYGERPHVRGRRVPVAMIAHNFRDNGWSIAETAYQFTLTEAEVLAALLYYEENKERIETQESIEQAQKDEMVRLHGKQE